MDLVTERVTLAIYIGVDGGGTLTRAVAVDETGRVVGVASAGGSNPEHTPHAERNAREAVLSVVRAVGCELRDVAGLVAGFAGLDHADDQVWAEQQTAVPGLDCPRLHVNDAVVAHAGALESRPGIIAISGTGSIVLGVTESGRHIRNYDFRHYAPSGAATLALDAIHRVLIGEDKPADAEFVRRILAFWNKPGVPALRAAASKGFIADAAARNYRFGAMASVVTQAAQDGSPLAQSVCDKAAQALTVGIRLMARCFQGKSVEVALIGGAVRSIYMQGAVAAALPLDPGRRFVITDPAFSPEIGAAAMALTRGGIPLTGAILHNLHTVAAPA